MRKRDVYNLAAGLLAAAVLRGLPAAAQSVPPAKTPKSKVAAALLELAKPAAPTIRSRARATAATGLQLRATDDVQVHDGYVIIEAVATSADTRQLLADLQARGLREATAYGAMVSGLMPINKLTTLEGLESLRQVRPAYKPVANVGSVTSQGDRALRADRARAQFGLSGKGVKVGIISTSYNLQGGAAAGVASGDLPANVQVLKENPDFSFDEGRGMAEIVHDVAPGADIAFYSGVAGQPDFAQGVEALQAAGCQVIVDDLGFGNEPFFQPGIIAQVIDKAVSRGAVYFSSAGNNAQNSYEAPFRNSGIQFLETRDSTGAVVSAAGEAHDFGNGDIRQAITVAPGAVVRLSLQWDDPFFSVSGVNGAKTDMDLYIVRGDTILFASQEGNIGGDPFEFVGFTNFGTTAITLDVVITKYDGPDPTRLKYVHFGSPPTTTEYDTRSSTLVGHANAERAVAVAAAAYFKTPLYVPRLPTAIVEDFSALGGTPLLFDGQGRRLRRPRVYNKPELTGPDGGNTTAFPPFAGADIEQDGFPNFFGTSAAAPHVAAVAALMLEATHGFLPPGPLTLLLQATAQDMDNPLTSGFDRGFDFKTGYGFVRADAALRPLAAANYVRQELAEAGQFLVSLFPNPSSGQVTFRITAPAQQLVKLTVVNQMGQEVFRGEGPQPLALTKDFSGLPKGLYVARAQTGTEVKTQLLQIE